MQNPSPSKYLADLDFTAPADLAIAFEFVRKWPKLRSISHEAMAESVAIVRHFQPLFSRQPETPDTRCAVIDFLWALGGSEPGGMPNSLRPLAPREWLCVFREAHRRGNIGPVAFGAAFGHLMVHAGGNGAPGLPAHSPEARRVMLQDGRVASPLGVMTDQERAAFAALPDTVTIWRGGSLAPGETLAHRAHGFHWALERQTSLGFMKGRNAERTLIALERWRGAGAGATEGLGDLLGRPFLLRVDAPKSAVLAYKNSGSCGELVELFMDFDRLPAAGFVDVTPNEYRWAA